LAKFNSPPFSADVKTHPAMPGVDAQIQHSTIARAPARLAITSKHADRSCKV